MKRIELNIQRFGHTNSTTNYELPQFIGTDKPQWLTDINQAFLAIDTNLYSVSSSATLANTSIGDLSDLTTTAKTDLVSAINEVDSDLGNLSTTVANHTTAIGNNTTAIGTLANLSTTAKTDLVSAINEVDNVATTNANSIGTLSNLDTVTKTDLVNAINEIVNKFNFSYKTLTISSSDPTVTLGNVNLNSAYNSDGSIGKIYGTFNTSSSASSGYVTTTITTSDTGLRPTAPITINGVLFQIYSRSGDATFTGRYSYTRSFTLNTNGTVSMEVPVWYDDESQFSFMACLIFASDFGDTPIPPTP